MQPKLLRAIEEHSIRRVGGNQPIRVDCRFLVASNRELRGEVNRGAFRSDLYYRLNTFPLRLPPLRERREDIPALIAHFLRQCGETDCVDELTERLAGTWVHREWPGNVRELRNAVDRVLILGELGDSPVSSRLLASVPPPAVPTTTRPASRPPVPHDFSITYRAAKTTAVAMWERDYLRALLQQHDGNLSRASRAVDMDRSYLRQLARRHGLID